MLESPFSVRNIVVCLLSKKLYQIPNYIIPITITASLSPYSILIPSLFTFGFNFLDIPILAGITKRTYLYYISPLRELIPICFYMQLCSNQMSLKNHDYIQYPPRNMRTGHAFVAFRCRSILPKSFRVDDDVLKWKPFPHHWPFARGIHRSPVNSPRNGPVMRTSMFLCWGLA